MPGAGHFRKKPSGKTVDKPSTSADSKVSGAGSSRHNRNSPKSHYKSQQSTTSFLDTTTTTTGHSSESEEEATCWFSSHSFHRLFGFRLEEMTSHGDFVRLLCRPCDPASLGVLRFLFGFLMVLDVFQERGLSMLDVRWGSVKECRFPLFDFLKPLPLQWMYVVYLLMLLGALGIMLGFRFRTSCLLYMGPYWYIFLLDKLVWNNHSYLFGILAFLFFLSSANRYWSIDGLLDPKIRNAHIPLWNYTLFRAQIFFVFFLAGLKKLDGDWVYGYSMQSLSEHWVFDPFKLLLTVPQIDLFIVHLGGLTIDLFIGFFLFFDKTRPFAIAIGSSFHLMNSQMFTIGMFPWAMLATQLLFCHFDWPRRLFRLVPPSLRLLTPEDEEEDILPSGNCLYSKQDVKSEDLPSKSSSSATAGDHQSLKDPPCTPPTKAGLRHKLCAWFTVVFVAWQCFLPYSHGITKGYNNWTNGLYGYSWDMMVHSWTIQHIRVTYHDLDSGQRGYLDPMVWTNGNKRWSSHADMIKQYGRCVAENLKDYGINRVEIYLDVWKSLNRRFQQRVIDPHVDILTAPWHPFKPSPWMLPLMTELSDWRTKLAEIESSLDNTTESHTEVVFVADFPGLHLENYVQEDFGNTSLSVLQGHVTVELIDKKKNVSLSPSQSLQIPAGTFHNIHTVSSTPSCYLYTFVNTTEVSFMKRYTQFEADLASDEANETLKKYTNDPDLQHYQSFMTAKKAKENKEKQNLFQSFKTFLQVKYNTFVRSLRITSGAVFCLVTNSSFDKFLNSTYKLEHEHIQRHSS